MWYLLQLETWIIRVHWVKSRQIILKLNLLHYLTKAWYKTNNNSVVLCYNKNSKFGITFNIGADFWTFIIQYTKTSNCEKTWYLEFCPIPWIAFYKDLCEKIVTLLVQTKFKFIPQMEQVASLKGHCVFNKKMQISDITTHFFRDLKILLPHSDTSLSKNGWCSKNNHQTCI